MERADHVTGVDVCDLCGGERPAGWRHGMLSYFSAATPCDYRCTTCGAAGVRLWRLYSSFWPGRLCFYCLETETGESPTRSASPQMHEHKGYVAAVPSEDGVGTWGFTSVPSAGVAWWERLPIYPRTP